MPRVLTIMMIILERTVICLKTWRKVLRKWRTFRISKAQSSRNKKICFSKS